MHKISNRLEIKFWWTKITSLFRSFTNKQRNTEIPAMTSAMTSAMTLWSEQWCALRWLVNLNSGLRPKLSRLVSVFGLNERLIQKVKRPITIAIRDDATDSRGLCRQVLGHAIHILWRFAHDLVPVLCVHGQFSAACSPAAARQQSAMYCFQLQQFASKKIVTPIVIKLFITGRQHLKVDSLPTHLDTDTHDLYQRLFQYVAYISVNSRSSSHVSCIVCLVSYL